MDATVCALGVLTFLLVHYIIVLVHVMSSHLTWQDSIVTILVRAKNMPAWLVNLGVFQEIPDDVGRAKPNGSSKSC